MKRRSLALGAAVFAAFAVATAPAHADDASYLQMLNDSGVNIPVSDNVRLTTGHYICGELRVYTPGYDVRRGLTNTFHFSPDVADVELEAAQSELCPDTRGNPVPNLSP
ncbi:MAG TPA: DUF732 domain-containing protein [Mycobacterium sp.]|nr:DUF732 domain-containing protein [Mycobacterium sp.]